MIPTIQTFKPAMSSALPLIFIGLRLLSVLEVRDVSISHDETPALRDVALAVEDGA